MILSVPASEDLKDIVALTFFTFLFQLRMYRWAFLLAAEWKPTYPLSYLTSSVRFSLCYGSVMASPQSWKRVQSFCHFNLHMIILLGSSCEQLQGIFPAHYGFKHSVHKLVMLEYDLLQTLSIHGSHVKVLSRAFTAKFNNNSIGALLSWMYFNDAWSQYGYSAAWKASISTLGSDTSSDTSTWSEESAWWLQKVTVIFLKMFLHVCVGYMHTLSPPWVTVVLAEILGTIQL